MIYSNIVEIKKFISSFFSGILSIGYPEPLLHNSALLAPTYCHIQGKILEPCNFSISNLEKIYILQNKYD